MIAVGDNRSCVSDNENKQQGDKSVDIVGVGGKHRTSESEKEDGGGRKYQRYNNHQSQYNNQNTHYYQYNHNNHSSGGQGQQQYKRHSNQQYYNNGVNRRGYNKWAYIDNSTATNNQQQMIAGENNRPEDDDSKVQQYDQQGEAEAVVREIETGKSSKSNDSEDVNGINGKEVDNRRSYRYPNGSNNHSSSSSGQYKRHSNQNYSNSNGYGNSNGNCNGTVQRRYNNGNSYNYNYRNNYGNNRRQYQHHNDYYHHQNHQYSNNHHDGYYNRGGNNRGYSVQSPPFYNNNQRKGHNGGQYSPDYDEMTVKRGNWPNSHINDDFSFNNSSRMGRNDKGYYSSMSQQCSPETSPTGTLESTSSTFLLAGNVISAQSLGPYDYLVGNMYGQHQNGTNGSYQYPYSQNYNYNYHAGTNGHDSPVCQPVAQLGGLGLLVQSDATCSPTTESCSGSFVSDKTTMEWPEDDLSEGSESESIPSSKSNRSNNADEDDDIPDLKKDSGLRLSNEVSVLPKETYSPNGTLYFRPAKRIQVSPFLFPAEWFHDFDPDEIVRQFSRAGEVQEKPPKSSPGCPMDSLSEAIWAKFFANQQSTETFRKKVELWIDIYRVVRILNFAPNFKQDPRNFPTFGLQVVGSTMSGFGSNTSDVDMCLLIRSSEVDQRFEAVERLQTLSLALKMLHNVENQELIYAKVPILKLRDGIRRLEIDLNCNNFVGIRNTHLLYSYAQMDWRLKPLVLVVKLWAQFHRINDAKNMTISSYSLVLMVIHFLQFGLEEPVLPVLHKLYPEKFHNNIPILNVKIHEIIPPWESRNKMGLGELLTDFLEYYARKFDYTRNVISVRLGGTVSIKSAANFRSIKNDPHQWKYLCVEEPFDRTNTARSVYDRDIFERILGIFYASWQRLQVNGELDSIFRPFVESDVRNISTFVSKVR